MNGTWCWRGSVWLNVAATIAAAGLLSGCAGDFSFPAVHDLPAPRADATMTPEQVKLVTDNLISERDHLSNEMQAGNAPQPAVPANAAITGTIANRGQTSAQPVPSGDQATGTAVTAGAYARP